MSVHKGLSCFNSRTLGRVRHTRVLLTNPRSWSFNSRTLGRVRLESTEIPFNFGLFQFTHPGKGATSAPSCACQHRWVSIHAPWEGCDCVGRVTLTLMRCFNSRTLGRVRQREPRSSTPISPFQFTHPGKGATRSSCLRRKASPVSIHAPWEGCDFTGVVPSELFGTVSIHAPWEGCDARERAKRARRARFQFTHPGKGATRL